MADPKIKYDIEANVQGDADVGKLVNQVEQLASTLDGDLKTSALASAAALRELANKNTAVQTFVDLKRESVAAADNLAQLQGAAQKMGAALSATETPTRAQAGQMQKLRDSVRNAKAEVIANSLALDQARGGLDKYGISTANLGQSQRLIKDAIHGARVEITAMAPAWQSTASAAAASAGQQVQSTKQIGGSLDALSSQLGRAKSELLALVGVGVGVQGIKDLAALSDGYKNLEARIKLTTGEGKAFDTAFAGVFDVAQRTNSAVEETGVLFTKLAEAGKPLGVSQSEALSLTETINQSIQLSGASAEASKASIVQLVQGLQSGVLRGDEFNSIMEQSPRLAKALADGLGVTTGELRKMSEAGQLSSATVIKALQGQSDAVQAEFGKLPATVGRAMQNLTTSFTAYVGEADKAGGYTAKLAGFIDGLAGNLSTVATVMIHTGQVLGAMKILSMAQDWITASAAIKTTASSMEVATASTIKGTAAKAQNTTATVANTAAQTANAAAWTGVAAGLGGVGPKLADASKGAATAAPMFGLLGGAVGGLMRAFAPLLALDIVLNFKSYGTAIGEWAAKLMGAKDRTAELVAVEKRATEEAAANAAARTKQAAATKEAADRTFGLTKEGSALIVKFDEMRTKGDSAAEAISKIGKDFDLSNIPGIRSAASVLDKLAADSKISSQQFQAAWADALKGADLGVFETQARAAFAGTAREAERVSQVLDASLRESIRRTGLDMEVISGGMGKAAQSAINDTEAMISGLDRLRAMGVDTGQALTASLVKGINTADSQKAIEALRAQIEAVRKVLGDKVADGLLDQAKQKSLDLKDALDKVKPGVDSLREAMKDLGVVSDQVLRESAKAAKEAYDAMLSSGTASVRELADGFKAYAEKAIAANNGVADAVLKTEAAMRGVAIQTDSTGKAIVSTMAQGAAAIKTVEDAYHQLGVKTPEELAKIAEANTAAWDKIKNDSNATLESLKTAFTAYAQAAIAASGSVGSDSRRATEELLQQEAAVKGLAVSFDAEGKMVVQTQAEAANAINGTTGALHGQRAAVDEVTAALEAQNAEQERATAAKEKAIALENKRLGMDAEHFAVDKDGKRITESSTTYSERGIYERAKSNGLTEEQSLMIAKRAIQEDQRPNFGAMGKNSWEGRLTASIEALVLSNAADRAKAEAATKQGGSAANQDQTTTQSSAPSSSSNTATTSQGSGSGGGGINVTINLAPGVDTSSRAGLEALARTLMPAIQNLQRRGA